MQSGQRPARLNPDAAELDAEDRGRVLGDYAALSPADRRRIVDSYRLAYLAEQVVNWCPELGTVLANEEVINGRSERGGHPVSRKPLRQWMFRITAFAERLLEGLADVDWPEATKIKQTAWIGRSEGAECRFELAHKLGNLERLHIYTTRPDTLFGATYMVVAPEHELVDALLKAPLPDTDVAAVREYVDRARARSDLDRQVDKVKTGVYSGARAINPVNGQSVPIWIADYVLMGYGHGAIMAVPAHDERDHEFAETFGLPIVEVVVPEDREKVEGCFAGAGRNVASKNDSISLNGLPTAEAKAAITAWLEKRGLGSRKVNYKLRDWLFSRQRYWGEPFPVVFDEAGDHHPVSESALPVVLPDLSDYQPEHSQEPRPLLAKAEDWVTTTAGAAGVEGLAPDAPVRRETNTMPNWAGSCWYYLRFCDPKNQDSLIGRDAERYWLGENGVDLYIGGAEHAVLHLLYARFWHQALYDLGHVGSPEPFRKLFHQGMITGYAYQRPDGSRVAIDEVDEVEEGVFHERADGKPVERVITKMSKSLKNVINPDDIIRDYGADTFRLYEMYMGPLEASKPWNTRDISGLLRFLQRTWRLIVDEDSGALKTVETADAGVEKLLHRTIAKVEGDIDKLAFNTAIAAMIKLVNEATAAGGMSADQIDRFVRVLAPFAPHLGEELWARLGREPSVASQPWPEYDPEALHEASVEMPVAIKGKVRARIQVASDADQATLERLALADPRIVELLADKTVAKVIVVPGRMVNIVTR
ncbi:MAG: leucine--tRNA ligase [Myxococcales bacterium]|nr:leucine--tRNA ligase [Myxococcales bacterium]